MVIWFAVVWFLWIQRNAIIFNNEQKDEGKVWETFKTRAWLWLVAKRPNFGYAWYDWISLSLFCLQGLS
ncbi:hypothetical protein JHK87_036247 [Glycine soja]|nr:hypothetical protein JHK87_036247 [Glycine soja]